MSQARDVRPDMGLDRQAMHFLAGEAVLAPSGDNVQPWIFPDGSGLGMLQLQIDEHRDRSPMNAGQRMSRIALGAALENVLRTVRASGGDAAFNVSSDGGCCKVRVSKVTSAGLSHDPAVRSRVTNRSPYNGQPLMPNVLPELTTRTGASEGVQAHWITAEPLRRELGRLIAAADEVMFGSRVLRDAFLKNVRFDRPPLEEVDWGLSLGSLELAGSELRAFRMLPRMPAWLLRGMRIGRTFAKGNRRLADSASGFCLGLAPDDEPVTDVHVGLVMQRAWLALTELGLAVQPMMSLLVLENVRHHGDPALREAVGQRALERVSKEFRRFTAEISAGRPAFLLRFGYAPPPSSRCGRLPPQMESVD